MSDQNTTSTATPKSGVELWKQAVRDQQTVVIEKQITAIKVRQDLDQMNGKEDLERSLLEIVNAFPEGIPFPLVRSVFDDDVALTKTRDSLKAAGKITFDETKRSPVLYPVSEPAQPQVEPAAK